MADTRARARARVRPRGTFGRTRMCAASLRAEGHCGLGSPQTVASLLRGLYRLAHWGEPRRQLVYARASRTVRCQVYAAVDPLAPVSAERAVGGAASRAVEPALVLDPDRLVYLRVRSLSKSE